MGIPTALVLFLFWFWLPEACGERFAKTVKGYREEMARRAKS